MQFITKNNKKKQNPKCKKCKKPTNKLHNICWDCHLKNEMKKLIIREIGRTKKWEQNYKSATTYNNFKGANSPNDIQFSLVRQLNYNAMGFVQQGSVSGVGFQSTDLG